MATRTISLVAYRNAPSQRAHFSIFVPSAVDSTKGTLIHVVGAPMAGYTLEFKRNYAPEYTQRANVITPIGSIYSENIVDSSPTASGKDSTPRGNIELVASQIPPPRISENFLAPVNDTTNRRCQEWTMDFVRRLVQVNYLNEAAIEIVQAQREPPFHGIGLQPAGRTQGHAGQAQAGQAVVGPWVWDEEYQKYRRLVNNEWKWRP